MKQLFNNENRIAVILKNIEMQSVCSVESLAAKLDVSQKTIRNDIKELNCLLGGYACISNNKGTCKLIVFAPKGFTEIRNKIYKQEDLFNSSHTRWFFVRFGGGIYQQPIGLFRSFDDPTFGRWSIVNEVRA